MNTLTGRIKTIARKYADWRVGALLEEKRCYKDSDSILLTFDDWGTPRQVEQILETLRAEDVKAAFFLSGEWAENHTDQVAQIAKAGHWIGGHGHSHRNLLKLDDEMVSEEISRSLTTPLFRPPFGKYDARIRTIAASHGKSLCYWSIDSDDWQGVSGDYMCNKITSELHPGAVVLLHLNGRHTPESLGEIIRAIRIKGFALTSFRERLSVEV